MGKLIYIDDATEDMALRIEQLQAVYPKNEYLEERLHLATMLQQQIGEQVATLIVREHHKIRGNHV